MVSKIRITALDSKVRVLGSLAVDRRGDDHSVQFLVTASVFDKPSRQPVKQRRVGRWNAQSPKITCVLNQPSTEMMLPNTIDYNAMGKGFSGELIQ